MTSTQDQHLHVYLLIFLITGLLSLLCDFRLLESASTCTFNLVLTVLPDKVTPNHPKSIRFWEHTIEAERPKLLIQTITCLFCTREVCNAQLIIFYLLATSFQPRYAWARSCYCGQQLQCWYHCKWCRCNWGLC